MNDTQSLFAIDISNGYLNIVYKLNDTGSGSKNIGKCFAYYYS